MFAERPHFFRTYSGPMTFPPLTRTARTAADRPGGTRPDSASAVAVPLLAYLQQRLGVRELTYSAPPAPVNDGWETYLYSFRLRGAGLPPAWDRPLMLRIHADP